jgi:Omp85 superfamily domain
MNRSVIFLALLLSWYASQAQTQSVDSVSVRIHPSYNQVNGFHRWLFGENYRREWAAEVKLPLIRISQIHGGLTAEQYGGGMETKSIRMKDQTGKEWVIRSVEKVPDKILPENLRQTFALDWVDDEYSGQHPYSALIVPPLAEAAGVPHTNPVIGVLVADSAMGTFSKQYAGRVVLLEERQPNGESANTFKMIGNLVENNSYRVNGEEFLRARLLDLLIGDWDRHEDQWRWTAETEGKDKFYTAVPRDRDQVMHVTQGVFPSIAAMPWLDPVLDNFDGEIPRVKYSMFKARFLQPYPGAQLKYVDWMRITNDFVNSETDEVLRQAINRLPAEIIAISGNDLLIKLKKRRDNIPAAMDQYYRFIYRIVDIRLSDKNEQVTITDTTAQAIRIFVHKLKENGMPGELLMDMTYLPQITREIRLYTEAGDDQVLVNNRSSDIKLRIIDSIGKKSIHLQQSFNKINVYGPEDSGGFTGDLSRVRIHLSSDTLNSRFLLTNPYNLWIPNMTGAINRDDGFLLGMGFRYIGRDGFRKLPYSTVQDVMLTHSFETNAFRLDYRGQWIQAIGKADLTLNALAEAPDNTMNFFGQGNGTVLNKTGNYHEFYRARFSLYQLDPALRWHTGDKSTFSFGPSLQYYHSNPADNSDRAVSKHGLITSYDSTTFNQAKWHIGLAATFISDQRNNKLLPSAGFYLQVKAQGYVGLTTDARSFAQLIPEFTYYQKVDTGAALVFSDRIGGGVSIGNAAFYQSLFLGGQGNLLGYLQNRFAGQQLFFNDLQARLRMATIPGYILPGELGLTGFFNTGRVWSKGESSGIWHQGQGAGIYFAPAKLTIIQIIAGHSSEGWYPYIAFNFTI